MIQHLESVHLDVYPAEAIPASSESTAGAIDVIAMARICCGYFVATLCRPIAGRARTPIDNNLVIYAGLVFVREHQLSTSPWPSGTIYLLIKIAPNKKKLLITAKINVTQSIFS